MSKLFDQLKDAARSREEKSPGLLVDALKRQQQGDPVTPGTPVAQAQSPEAEAPAPDRISSYSGVGLAIVIFLVAVLAWRSAPWSPPKKHRIDPSELKLDRSLDPQRIPSRGTSPARTPS